MLTVYFVDRPPQQYQTASYNCQGGFIMIIESFDRTQKTTCIPAALINYVVVTQNI